MTLEEALERLQHKPDRIALETYISRAWVRPVKDRQDWRFEEIDIARAQLVHQLQVELGIGTDALDTVLNLLDQVYALREQMRRLHAALSSQPPSVRSEIVRMLAEAGAPPGEA